MNKNSVLLRVLLLITMIPAHVNSVSMESDDLWFFVLVKSNNYAQDQDGKLTLLNYHFFS